MQALEPAMSESPRTFVRTNVDSETPMSARSDAAAAWDRVLDRILVEWNVDRESFVDEGLEPPSLETIDRAASWAKEWKKLSWPAPTRVVPDTHGGIVFELQHGPTLESLRVIPEGSVEYCCFVNSKLTTRTSF